LKERAVEINQLLEQRGYFYVCGDAANMAREVNTILGNIISEQRGLPAAKGEDLVKLMRNSNQYQEDVWS
jgi:NADPH-ferrihemoprotein reductase